MRLRAWGLSVFALCIALSGVVYGAHVYARGRVQKEALARHVDLTFDSLQLRPFGAILRNVQVHPEGVPGVHVRINEVRVSLSSSFKVKMVSLAGGAVELEGGAEQLKRDVAAWKQSFSKVSGVSNGDTATASDKRIEVSDLRVQWKLEDGSTVLAEGVAVEHVASGYRVRAKHAEATASELAVNIADLDVETSETGSPHAIHAGAVTVTKNEGDNRVSVPRVTEPRPSATAERDDPSLAPPPLPVDARMPRSRVRKDDPAVTRSVASAAPPEPFDVRLYKAPDLRKAQLFLRALATRIEAKVPVDSSLDVKTFRIDAELHGQRVIFGGPLAATRDKEKFRLEFASERAQDGASLKATLILPLSPGETRFQFSGGPLPLSLMGMERGSLGVQNPQVATLGGEGYVSLDEDATRLRFDVNAALGDVSLLQPRLAKTELQHLNAAIAARGELAQSGKLSLENTELRLGRLRATFKGTVDPTPASKPANPVQRAKAETPAPAPAAGESDHIAVNLEGEVAPSNCQDIKESLPQALLPDLAHASFGGTFGATVRLRFDTRRLDDLFLDYKVDARCRMVDVPYALSRERFRRPFAHLVYGRDGEIHEETTGPGTEGWTSLDDISPHMQAAVLTTEDGHFFKHHGFNPNTVRGALVANLKAGRFVRGASTISMQLSKNLFLSRDKTLSRKFEEIVLTDYIESVFTKEEMMEMYLNIIEFGPDVYGIGRASDHYFGRKPDELNVAECMFLASVLPSPIRFHQLYERDSHIPDHWMSHLKTLLGYAEKNGRVTAAEVNEALAQPVMFHKPNTPRPDPRPRVVRGTIEESIFENLD